MSLWGGRFDDGPSDALWRFTVDTADRRLLAVDVRGSMAHVAMLGDVGILSGDEVTILTDGLHRIRSEAEDGDFAWLEADEDVHSAVERRLGELVGDVAGKLHTARSRNDQVALDLRLYIADAIDARTSQIDGFIRVLIDQAIRVGDVVVAGYTHLQQAQAVPFGHHLLAYAWMLLRDRDRLLDARARVNVSPLGAAALGGTSLPIDPERSAELLGMEGTFENSLDAVGSRDMAAEYVWCAAQTMIDLSRLAEELVLWCTTEFGWATFADAFTTGSSALPQKKNADIAELVRGRAGALVGDLSGILAVQKGLPMSYNRDFQEDKRLVFHADDVLAGALDALRGLVGTATFHPAAPDSWVTAVDLAEALVERGVPFRDAHHVVGRLVSSLVAEGRSFEDLSATELESFDGRFTAGDIERLDPAWSIANRSSRGGGSLASVEAQIAMLEGLLAAG